MSPSDVAFTHSNNAGSAKIAQPENSCKNHPALIIIMVIVILAAAGVIIWLLVAKPNCDNKKNGGTTTGAKAAVITHAPIPHEVINSRGNPHMKTVTHHPVITQEDVGDEDVVTQESIRDFFQNTGPQMMFDEEDQEGDIEPSITFGLASRTNVPMNQDFQETLADHDTMTHKQKEKTNKQIASQSALAFMPEKTAQAMNKASKGKLKMPSSLSHGSEEHSIASALESNFQTLGQDSDDESDDATSAAVARTAANQISIGSFDSRYKEVTNKMAPGRALNLDSHLRPELDIVFDICEPNNSQFHGSQAWADAKNRLAAISKDVTCYRAELTDV